MPYALLLFSFIFIFSNMAPDNSKFNPADILENFFKALSPEQQIETLKRLNEAKTINLNHNIENINLRSITPPPSTGDKRGLNSPETPYHGGSRKEKRSNGESYQVS